MNYYNLIAARTKIKQDLARLLWREFTDLSSISITSLAKDVEALCGTYEGSVMRPELINAYQFIYVNKGEQ